MNYINSSFLHNLNTPLKNSHKGDNGKLTIIGGSKLFHGASLWALRVASQIVDMLYYSSVSENYELIQDLKKDLYSFICIPLGKEEDYLAESDAILIGPGMVRGDENYTGTGESGEQTKQKVLNFLHKFPDKKWVIDAGALQTISLSDLTNLKDVIITPHAGEFNKLFEQETINRKQETKNVSFSTGFQPDRESHSKSGHSLSDIQNKAELVLKLAKTHNLTIVLKGPIDIIASPSDLILNKTGNEGMTKGGTGDVLAGLISALFCTNDAFTSAAIGAYINGLAGDFLYQSVGPFFNADQLAAQVPKTLWEEIKNCRDNS